MPISKTTAMDIALSHREIEIAEELLKDIKEALQRRVEPDIRDAFGRPRSGLQLGVPSGNDSTRLFNVPWTLAAPIIEAHIAHHRNLLAALDEKIRIELQA